MYLFRILLLSALAVSSACCLWADTTQILQNDPSITYTGVWYPNYESGNIGGSATFNNDKGARAAIIFTGTGITWIGVPDQYSGMAQVYLDGTPNTADTYAPNTPYQQPLFAAHGLAPGAHTLSIQVLYRDQWSGIANVYVDGTLNGTIDTNAKPQQAQTVAFAVSGLVPGLHTLTIGVTGIHDAASAGSWIWADAFSVAP
jgi:hypothetical protein